MGKFSEKLKEQQRLKNIENLSVEDKKNRELSLVKDFLNDVESKKNRYIFYCPDLDIPLQTLRTIYQTVDKLIDLGFNAYVLHENNTFENKWLNEKYKIKTLYINEGKKKDYHFKFKPTDTFIVPDGFIGIMESVADNLTINKIVYLMSYEGLATLKQNTWYNLGFNKVISVSEELIEDYKSVFPELEYYYLPFYINEENMTQKFGKDQIKPIISLFSRSKKEASQFINIFYNKYKFLDLFQFKVIRQLNSKEYYDTLSESSLMIVMDSESGCMVPPLEASYYGVPVILFENRSMKHLEFYKENIIKTPKDIFSIVDEVATFCLNWLSNSNNDLYDAIENKEYSKNNFNKKIIIFETIQEDLKLKFENILKAKQNENN